MYRSYIIICLTPTMVATGIYLLFFIYFFFHPPSRVRSRTSTENVEAICVFSACLCATVFRGITLERRPGGAKEMKGGLVFTLAPRLFLRSGGTGGCTEIKVPPTARWLGPLIASSKAHPCGICRLFSNPHRRCLCRQINVNLQFCRVTFPGFTCNTFPMFLSAVQNVCVFVFLANIKRQSSISDDSIPVFINIQTIWWT